MKKKVHAGFSIIEIMVALGIVLSMAVAILPVGNNYFALGRNSSSKTGVATLATAISQYKFETGEYPLNLNSLTVRMNNMARIFRLRHYAIPGTKITLFV